MAMLRGPGRAPASRRGRRSRRDSAFARRAEGRDEGPLRDPGAAEDAPADLLHIAAHGIILGNQRSKIISKGRLILRILETRVIRSPLPANRFRPTSGIANSDRLHASGRGKCNIGKLSSRSETRRSHGRTQDPRAGGSSIKRSFGRGGRASPSSRVASSAVRGYHLPSDQLTRAVIGVGGMGLGPYQV